MQSGVGAVVVTFFPDPTVLGKLIASLLPQVSAVMIVDNTPGGHLPEHNAAPAGCTLLRFGENLGIATAHNAGISWAREQGFEYILLLDQDSITTKGMVKRLRTAAADMLAQEVPLAAVGPRTVDPRSGASGYATRITPLGVQRVECAIDDTKKTIQTDILVSSGMLIPVSALDKIGRFEEGLFIDQVDHEWCLRARGLGYCCFLACDTLLIHQLGTETVRYWLGRWRNAPLHSPMRHYHMLRNTLLLMGRRYVPAVWSLGELRRFFSVFVIALSVLPQRRVRLMLMFRAFWHGLMGRSGSL